MISSSAVACNDTVDVDNSTAISLHMTSSLGGSDVISRYPPSGCRLHVAARRGQRLSFTVFTLGEAGWAEQDGGGSTSCDARRRRLYIDDGGRTASSSLCHLPRYQSRHRLAYTTTHWRVAVHWTWTAGHSTDTGDDRFTSYVLNVEGQNYALQREQLILLPTTPSGASVTCPSLLLSHDTIAEAWDTVIGYFCGDCVSVCLMQGRRSEKNSGGKEAKGV